MSFIDWVAITILYFILCVMYALACSIILDDDAWKSKQIQELRYRLLLLAPLWPIGFLVMTIVSLVALLKMLVGNAFPKEEK